MSECVVVTGAGHGIGTSIARAFLKSGASVLLVDVNESSLLTTAQTLQLEFRDNVYFVTADLSTTSGVDTVLRQARRLPNKVTCLINNAADQTQGTTLDTTVDTFQRTMFINVTAPFLLVQGLIQDLMETKGSVVNIGSLVGNQPIPGRVAYSTSKAALAGLTRSLSVDLGNVGIRVNAVAPGHIMTDGVDTWKSVYSEFQQQIFPTSYALERVGYADEVAAAVLFLASSSAGFITGVTLPVDGGMSVLCPETASFTAAKIATEAAS